MFLVSWQRVRPFAWLPVVCQATLGHAQPAPPSKGSEALGALAANSLIGALTAASRAWLGHKGVRRATLQGAGGGALVFLGKSLAPNRGVVAAWSGVGISALGSSVISNAGSGTGAFSQVVLPVGPIRLRVLSDGRFAPRASINAYETSVFANRLSRRGLHFDLERSLRTGALHFMSERRPIVHGAPATADGVTAGGIVVLSQDAHDGNRTQTHEMIHVHQQWFLSQNFSDPIESAVRRRWSVFRVIPSWIDIGIAWSALYLLEHALTRGEHGPLFRLEEREADLFERLRER